MRLSRYGVIISITAALLMTPFLFAFGEDFDVGLKVGEKIPTFRMVDLNGKDQTFESLKGPKGLALLFFRSANW